MSWFTYLTGRLASGTTARSTAVNVIFDAIATAFALLPTDSEIKLGTIKYGTDSGAANAYVVTLPYTPSALTDGMIVVFKPANTNTSATVTLNVDSLGAVAVTLADGTAPSIGDLKANYYTVARYNSTNSKWEIISITPSIISCIAGVAAASSGSGVLVSSNDTTLGYLNGKLLAGEGIDLTEGNDGGDETLTISAEDATTSNKGVASFATADFSISSGAVSKKQSTTAKTANYSVVAADLTGSLCLTNTGASGTVNITLLAATVGRRLAFLVDAAQAFRATPDGTDYFTYSGTDAGAGKYIESSTVGRYWEIECLKTGEWHIVGLNGAITYEE